MDREGNVVVDDGLGVDVSKTTPTSVYLSPGKNKLTRQMKSNKKSGRKKLTIVDKST